MEFTAKTVEEAVKLGLAELGISEEQAIIEIIEQPTKGLFGKLKGKAVVEINAKKDEKAGEQKAVELVENVLKLLGIEANATISENDECCCSSHHTCEYPQPDCSSMNSQTNSSPRQRTAPCGIRQMAL